MDPDLSQRLVFAENLTPYEVVDAKHITDDSDESRFQVRGHFVDGDVIYDALKKILGVLNTGWDGMLVLISLNGTPNGNYSYCSNA